MSNRSKYFRLRFPKIVSEQAVREAWLEEEGLTSGLVKVEGGEIASLSKDVSEAEEQVTDFSASITFPGWVDSHTHLDKAHSWTRAPNPTHSFQGALEILGEDKVNWTEEDLYKRADFTLRSAWYHGVSAIRTHVDTWGDETKTSFSVLSKLKEEWKGRIELQLVSLCSVDQYSGPDGETFADLPVEYGADCLGGMPLMNPDLPAQLDQLMKFAVERKVGLDLHVDESGDPNAECLRAVAEAVLRNEFPYRVTCGHCCSLAVQDFDRALDTLHLVKESGIQMITLPLCNAYLQDRRDANAARITPHWRGLTLLREAIALGIPCAAASDNVRDAFYAYGDLNTWEVMIQTIRLGHLDTQYPEAATLVTKSAANIMELDSFGRIDVGCNADFVAFEAPGWSELLSRPWLKPKVFRGGEISDAELPDFGELGEIV